MDHSNVGTALLLSAGAGLATTFGSVLGILVREPGKRFMGISLGFSAGVMIMIAFTGLLPSSVAGIGPVWAYSGFFLGMVGFFALDFLIPHEFLGEADYREGSPKGERLKRMGLLVALGIGIHNVPEGLATFAGSLKDVRAGLFVAVGIALNNIPEGLAVAAPIYASTGNRRKAFLWSFLSGLSEPASACVAALVLMPFLNATLVNLLLSGAAGIMIAISLDQLAPAAKTYGSTHTPIIGMIGGMMVVVAGLLLMRLV